MWLNSVSKLKYPVAFIEGETRKAELIYGEAYFDISPSSAHNGSKFKVLQNKQEVQVLGTEFNIKAYKDESITYTTLVEGKVKVSLDEEKQNLIPGQQSSIRLDDNSLIINEVDVYSEISWKDGVFSFEDKPLQEIMKVLSRWYDIDVVFENENIKNEKFVGLLRKDQNMEDIISTIKDMGFIKAYEIKDKTLRLR